ncbi:MAG: hypothetical protein A2293_08885 [Elusimicrobia bacterium RIFOXYB2_FULL_49_7]|nr:MAG: hypothetical protein A2293_08885 [Elusimicrobia bacterium RIFOXYB2_FULL_49_7]
MIKTISILFVLSAALMAGNVELGVQSAIVPGMGQMAAGEGKITRLNTAKGLGIMAGFAVCIHGVFNSLSEYDAYSEQTRILEGKYNQDGLLYSDRDSLRQAWDDAFQNAGDAKTRLVAFSLLSAAVYAYGIVDAVLFTRPAEKKEETSSGVWQRSRFSLTRKGELQGVEVRVGF